MEYDDDVFVKEESYWNKTIGPVIYVFESYGWYILIVLVFITLLYHRTLKSYWQKYKEFRFEREYAAKYHKNPDLFEAHMNAREKWTQKMQEQYNKENEEYQKKMKEKEEKKKQELIEKYGDSQGHVLGRKSDNNQTNLRQDYNPLMGGGSGSSYRPPRRSPCGGGGCGR